MKKYILLSLAIVLVFQFLYNVQKNQTKDAKESQSFFPLRSLCVSETLRVTP